MLNVSKIIQFRLCSWRIGYTQRRMYYLQNVLLPRRWHCSSQRTERESRGKRSLPNVYETNEIAKGLETSTRWSGFLFGWQPTNANILNLSWTVSYPAGCLELTDNEVTEYYQPKDFRIGSTIFVYGRRFLLLDCDPFTRKYYADVLKSPQNSKLKIEFPKKPLPKRVTTLTTSSQLQNLSKNSNISHSPFLNILDSVRLRTREPLVWIYTRRLRKRTSFDIWWMPTNI